MSCDKDCLDCENQECEDKTPYAGPFIVSFGVKVYRVFVRGDVFKYTIEGSQSFVEYHTSELDAMFVKKVRQEMVSEVVCKQCGKKADKGKPCWWCGTRN